MSRSIPGVVLLLFLVVASQARAARTLAVLPLEQGAGSEAYAGLGTALAGMLVSDLAQVETLQLVERARLDEVLAEMELSETGFLDAATAQKLGGGLGSELLITGSYSVVEDAFLLDARVVEVESGAVLQAVDAQGTVADFVTVEKDLVEALLERLEVTLSSSVRRKLLTETPTESFPAFAAYGEGLSSQAAGRVEEAKRSFETALELDPQFVEAREAVAALRSLVETDRARVALSKAEKEAAVLAAVFEAVPDDRTLPADHEYDVLSTARFALRLLVLEELELHCQCYEEMWSYGEREDWLIHTPREAKGHDLFEHTMLTAIEMELIDDPGRLRTIPFDRPSVASMPGLFYRIDRYVLDLDASAPGDGKGRGVLGAMFLCFGPAEQLEQIRRIQEAVRRAGLADTEPDHDTYPGVSLDDHLETVWALTHAKHLGMTGQVAGIAEEVVERQETEMGRRWAVSRAGSIAEAGDGWDRRAAIRQGLSTETLLAINRALVAGEGSPVRWDTPYCAYFAADSKNSAEHNLEMLAKDEARGSPRYTVWSQARLGSVAAPLRDMGCIEGLPGRFADVYEIYAWVGTADQRKRADHAEDEGCVSAFETLPSRVNPTQLDAAQGRDEVLQRYAKSALDWYYPVLVHARCVEDSP